MRGLTAERNYAEFGVQLKDNDTVNALGHNDILHLAHGDIFMTETIDSTAHIVTLQFSETGQSVTILRAPGIELQFSSGHVQDFP